MEANPSDHFCQVWQGDYSERKSFFTALNKINSIPKEVLNGMTIYWSDIPYSLDVFASFFVATNVDGAEKYLTMISSLMEPTGAKLRTDITNIDLITAMTNRQLNQVGVLEGDPVPDPCHFATKSALEKKGYVFKDWTSQNRVFLSHQNDRKEQVSLLQQLLASHDVGTWMDIHDIEFGEPLATAIDKGIEKSTSVIFWINDNFLKSNWCKFEFEGFLNKYANQPNVRLLTVVEDGCQGRLPDRLKSLKYLQVDAPGDPRHVAKMLSPTLRKNSSDTSDDYWS